MVGTVSVNVTLMVKEYWNLLAVANNPVVVNSKFVKKDNHLIAYQSGGCSSQKD